MKSLPLLCTLLCIVLASCGGGDSCTLIGMTVSPPTATADHNAASPANTMQFIATSVTHGKCAAPATKIPQSPLWPDWSVSDTVNVSISNVHDGSFGVATCLNSTAAPVTVTATLQSSSSQIKTVSGTAKLTCN